MFPQITLHMQADVIAPTVTGTLNVLKACYEGTYWYLQWLLCSIIPTSRTGSSLTRCTLTDVWATGPRVSGPTSQGSASEDRFPNWPKGKAFDEDSWSDEYCRKTSLL
jgi:hypothetical protein